MGRSIQIWSQRQQLLLNSIHLARIYVKVEFGHATDISMRSCKDFLLDIVKKKDTLGKCAFYQVL